MASTRIKDLLKTGQLGDTVTVKGWVRTKREQKAFSFINVNDGSNMGGLQVVADAEMPNYETVMKRVNTGASVTISGSLVKSPAKGQRVELKAERITVYGEADETYPLQKKRHSFEFLRTIGHLRSRTNTLGAVFRVRSACAQAIHQFFQEQGFMWIHSPV
ncbi:MAG: OB-fold nucleic acid binding domain-containing protein, partial [Cyanobacteria bacterium J06559_3]